MPSQGLGRDKNFCGNLVAKALDFWFRSGYSSQVRIGYAGSAYPEMGHFVHEGKNAPSMGIFGVDENEGRVGVAKGKATELVYIQDATGVGPDIGALEHKDAQSFYAFHQRGKIGMRSPFGRLGGWCNAQGGANVFGYCLGGWTSFPGKLANKRQRWPALGQTSFSEPVSLAQGILDDIFQFGGEGALFIGKAAEIGQGEPRLGGAGEEEVA